MFGFYNLKHNFSQNKRTRFIVLALFFAGFISGCCYSNFINDDTFLKSMRSMDGYLKGDNSFSYTFNDEISLLGIFFWWPFYFRKSCCFIFCIQKRIYVRIFCFFSDKSILLTRNVSRSFLSFFHPHSLFPLAVIPFVVCF